MRRFLVRTACSVVVVAFALLFWHPSLADEAGIVLRLRGLATAVYGDRNRTLAVGDAVKYGEQIATATNTRLQLRLLDGAVITVGDNSTFTVEGYEPDDKGIIFDFLNGVFLGITDSEDEKRTVPMTIETTLGAIGIRGTTFWGRIDPGHLQVALLEGRSVFVDAFGQRIELTPDRDGVDVFAPGLEGGRAPGQAGTEASPTIRHQKWGEGRLARSRADVSFE